MSDQEEHDRAHDLAEAETGGLPVVALVRELVAGITTQVQRVSGLFGSLLRKIGLRLESRDSLHHSERKRVINNLFHERARLRPFFARFMSLMALSVTIASLGIVSNSTAVVIGAMLVAPLMGPVLGVAAAVVMAWPLRAFRQAALVAGGAVLAIGLASLISLIVPGNAYPLPAELVARTSPNLLDMGIALAAGAAGAYGQVRRQASGALPGVAVAVALVPPLAVTGITVQLAEWQMALGAFLLFLVNVVGIVISAALTFIVCGFVPGRRLLTGNSTIAAGLRWTALAVIIVVLPLLFGRGRVLPPTDQTAEAIAAVEDFVDSASSSAEVVDVSIEMKDGITNINVVVASPIEGPPVLALAHFLAERLNTPVNLKLQVVEATTSGAIVVDP